VDLTEAFGKQNTKEPDFLELLKTNVPAFNQAVAAARKATRSSAYL
jgi:hypothetical protein